MVRYYGRWCRSRHPWRWEIDLQPRITVYSTTYCAVCGSWDLVRGIQVNNSIDGKSSLLLFSIDVLLLFPTIFDLATTYACSVLTHVCLSSGSRAIPGAAGDISDSYSNLSWEGSPANFMSCLTALDFHLRWRSVCRHCESRIPT